MNLSWYTSSWDLLYDSYSLFRVFYNGSSPFLHKKVVLKSSEALEGYALEGRLDKRRDISLGVYG